MNHLESLNTYDAWQSPGAIGDTDCSNVVGRGEYGMLEELQYRGSHRSLCVFAIMVYGMVWYGTIPHHTLVPRNSGHISLHIESSTTSVP
eukprot:scaffold5168_cov176-Amphora_coffeaeformis.AAC.1